MIPRLPLRTAEHIIDTRAVRLVLQDLPPELLVRSMEERDYGIDLQLELFDGTNPTGQMALVQVKGREKKFPPGKKVGLNFPVKTVEYARLFDMPFFVFYTSLNSKGTYFLWLQRYANAVLDVRKNQDKWRSQKNVKIFFPNANKLDTGAAMLKNYISSQRQRRDALDVFKIEGELRRFGKLALGVEPYPRQTCIHVIKLLPTLAKFLGESGFDERLLKKYSAGLLEAFENAEILTDGERQEAMKSLASLIEALDGPLMQFTSQGFSDQADARLGGSPF